MNLQQRNDYIIEQYKNGRSTNQIADELNINSGTVYFALKKNNIEIKSRKNFDGHIEDKVDVIVRMYKNGMSAYKISKESGISQPTVLRCLKKQGFDLSSKSKRDNNNLLKDKFDQVLELYNKGKNCNQISKILGHNRHHIKQLLEKNGHIVKNACIKYDVDETFFEKIDNQNKAYMLGFFYTDGNNGGNHIKIQLQKEDSYILERFAELMGYTGPLSQIPPPKKFPHRKSQVEFRVTRTKLADQLTKLGCMPAKSLIIKFPSSKIVPNHLLSHFVRGYFDGDGSVSFQKNRVQSMSITSTDTFLNDLQTKILEPLRIYTKYYYRYENKNSATLFIGKQEDIQTSI